MALASRPHALMIPYPLQGHITPMMQLAQILASTGFTITFVNTEASHARIMKSQQEQRHQRREAKTSAQHEEEEEEEVIRLVAVTDGLPEEIRTQPQYIREKILATEQLGEALSLLLHKLQAEDQQPPVSLLICDCFMAWSQNVGKSVNIPTVALWTSSPHSYLPFASSPQLISEGYLPVKPSNRSDIITWIPGLPPIFKVADLHQFLLEENISDPLLQFSIRQANHTSSTAFTLVNSFEYLANPKELGQPFVSIGPLLAFGPPKTRSNFWPEDYKCLSWLDSQSPSSVLYISFGSLATLSSQQLEEIALGLEASNQPFLWAFRPGLQDGASSAAPLLDGFIERTKGQGYIVAWAPQLQVLSHASVGGFLTHCGWNSIMESIYCGVPMLGWPYFADQRMNCKLLVDVWGVGMECRGSEEGGVVGREEVERAVRGLMGGEEGREVRKEVEVLREGAKEAVTEGGSSKINLDRFVNEMKRVSIHTE